MIRRFLEFAVDRPWLNHILFILIMVMALFAYKQIPKEIFPPANLEKIVISGGYIGTSANILDKMAVQPIEEDLKSVENISNIESVIQNGSFSISADIKSGANEQLVLNDVKDVIASIKNDLPSDMREPTARVLVHNFPLLLIAVSGNRPKAQLLKASKELKNRLSSIKDLNKISIRGDADDEIKIELNPAKLEAYGISKEEFYRAISTISSIFPAGNLKSYGKEIYLSTINGAKSAKEFEDTIIAIGNKRIRVGDVATVRYGLSRAKEISHFNGNKNISINVTKTERGNAIYLSKKIRKLLSKFAKKYPDLKFEVYTDTSIWIKNRINLVSSNIAFGLILVFTALFLSVNWKIASVVALGIPTSFFIALIGADMLGYSMNMLTMLGALIALGMLVDEAIVVAENIFRHIEMGKSPREAAIDGALEMFPAVMTATMTTVFAFLPLLIMSGQLGIFMKVLPVMITILLLSSLFEAFYFLPLHAKELFSLGKRVDTHQESQFWDRAREKYKKILSSLLKHKKSALLILVVSIIFGTIFMLKISKFQLFPPFDASQIYISGKVDVNNRLEDTQEYIKQVEEALIKGLNKKDVSSVTSIVGMRFNADQTAQRGENLFHIFVNLHERAPENFFDKYINPYLSIEYDDSDMIREHSSQEILKRVAKLIEPFKGLKVADSNKLLFEELSAFVPQAGIVGHDIEISFSASSDELAQEAMREIQKRLKEIKGVTDIENNAKAGPMELKLKLNEYGRGLGFDEGKLISILRGLYLDIQYSKAFDSRGLVYIKIEDPNRDKNIDIKSINLSTPDGKFIVKLSDIASLIYKNSTLKIYKEDGQKLWTLTARVDKDTILPSEVMQKIRDDLERIRKRGIKVLIKGEEKENKQVKSEMGQAGIIALFLIFISLVWMFNSLVLPLLTITVIPLSILGALIGNHIIGINLSMPGLMGIVGLAGVVVNDALIMLDFIKRAKDSNEIVELASMRLRPIFLTSLTTVLGLTSLIFFASGQSLIIQPMAVALGFGVAWATVLNLIYMPLLYAVVYRVK